MPMHLIQVLRWFPDHSSNVLQPVWHLLAFEVTLIDLFIFQAPVKPKYEVALNGKMGVFNSCEMYQHKIFLYSSKLLRD